MNAQRLRANLDAIAWHAGQCKPLLELVAVVAFCGVVIAVVTL
jgi:hypothetical protein